MHSIRPAAGRDEQRAVYLMGRDAWGEGAPEEDYLRACAASPKYARGAWYVLEEDGRLVCSLIRYRDSFGLAPGSWGLGSLATPPPLRGRGYASALVHGVLESEPGTAFLFADIGPEFYRRLGFSALPAVLQPLPGTTLMARGELPAGFAPPSYF